MESLIEKIKRDVRITDVVAHLRLEHGRNTSKGFFVKSIYKEENTPSMQINVKDDSYFCFATGNNGTQKPGDQIQLYKDAKGIDTSTAVKELANIFGIATVHINNNGAESLPRSAKQIAVRDLIPKALQPSLTEEEALIFREGFDAAYEKNLVVEVTEAFKSAFDKKLAEVLKPVKEKRLVMNKKIFQELYHYTTNLAASDKQFFEYLVNRRKLDIRKVMAFKLIFITDYFKVNNHMKKAFPLADLQRSGLYNKKEDGTGNLIFFNHRIVIPYLFKNEIAYLRGRYFDKDGNSATPAGQSKYIGLANDGLNVNTARRFYNLDVLDKMLPGEHLLLVEGELDAIAGECLGKNTMGIPGAQNIPAAEKFKKLLEYQITLCGDDDEAGSGMISKLKEIFLSLNKKLIIKHIAHKDLNDLLAA